MDQTSLRGQTSRCVEQIKFLGSSHQNHIPDGHSVLRVRLLGQQLEQLGQIRQSRPNPLRNSLLRAETSLRALLRAADETSPPGSAGWKCKQQS